MSSSVVRTTSTSYVNSGPISGSQRKHKGNNKDGGRCLVLTISYWLQVVSFSSWLLGDVSGSGRAGEPRHLP